MTALEAYILARAYTKQAVEGAGALKGAPCQIQSITPITGGNRITFAWENSEGETETDTLDVMDGTDGTDGTDGVGISSITFKEKDASGNNVYTVTLTNTNTYDITCPIGPQGETGATGNGIVSITKTGTSGLVDTYTITYTNGQTTSFTVTNGKGNNEFLGTLEEWNALTTAEKKAYDTYQIIDDYTSGSGLPNYSTTEQKTGQKWIDGKDIYKKSVTIDSLVLTGATQSIQHGIANIDKVVGIESYAFLPHTVVMNCYDSSNYYSACYCDGTYINYTIKWGQTSMGSAVVTLYYTKTA